MVSLPSRERIAGEDNILKYHKGVGQKGEGTVALLDPGQEAPASAWEAWIEVGRVTGLEGVVVVVEVVVGLGAASAEEAKKDGGRGHIFTKC